MKKVIFSILFVFITVLAVSNFGIANSLSTYRITPDYKQSNQYFGASLSLYNNYVAIGAYGSGSVYVFKMVDDTWIQEKRINVNESFFFGREVNMYEDYMIISDYSYNGHGAAFIYQRNGSDWLQKEFLEPNDTFEHQCYGASIVISDGYAMVGDSQDKDKGQYSGSVYVYKFDGNNWIFKTKLFASDGSYNDYFGSSLAMDSNFLVVGAKNEGSESLYKSGTGAVYIFELINEEWIQTKKLKPDELMEGDHFGYSVDIFADTIIVGANTSDEMGSSSGSAYIFKCLNQNWIKEVKLVPDDGSTQSLFGCSVAIYDKLAIIGAWGDNNFDGSIYVFEKKESSWSRYDKILDDNVNSNDSFGTSVDIFDRYIIGGSHGMDIDGISNSGAAYIHKLKSFDSVLTGKILTSYEHMGYTASVGGATVISIPSNLSATTDIYGNFSFTSIPTGNCIIKVASSYFESISKSIQIEQGNNEITLTFKKPKGLYRYTQEDLDNIEHKNNQTISQLNQAIAEKYTELSEKENMITEKEGTINQLSQTISDMYTELSEKESIISSKEETIDQLSQTISGMYTVGYLEKAISEAEKRGELKYDINADGQVGLEEVIKYLEDLSGVRIESLIVFPDNKKLYLKK